MSAGLITRRTVADGRTIVEATLDPGSSTDVSWSMRDSTPSAAARELRTLSEVMTLVTLGDSDVRMVALIDLTVLQGELRTLGVRLPPGYELTGVSGSSLENGEPADGSLTLTIANPAARSHQFLISLERTHDGGSFSLDTGLVSVRDVQRERGEIAIEGVGTLELDAKEREPLHRIDVRELSRPLQSLARLPVLSAFRYQRAAGATPTLAFEVTRFADAGVLAAVADRADATTLVTSEGRALTEVILTVQNRAQPFLKVSLPPGATMVSVDVAGQPAKPVLGADGTRVPLLRPGFRPTGTYRVSFVYLHAGTPFAKKGDIEMTLPRMDMPVGIVEWELFAPERYSVKSIGGNAIDLNRMRAEHIDVSGAYLGSVLGGVEGAVSGGVVGGIVGGLPAAAPVEMRTGSVEERVTVVGETPVADAQAVRRSARAEVPATQTTAPSQNVINLQQRTTGVLPVRIDVPRAGTSHQFIKPLVVDQETTVKLRYKRR